MIDLKLNELPIDAQGQIESDFETNPRYTEAQKAEIRLRRQRGGLSINDTIAGDAVNSMGGRGVNTSGPEDAAGSGAGAGMSTLTPSAGESLAPDIASPKERAKNI
jgi:hypothetical protein